MELQALVINRSLINYASLYKASLMQAPCTKYSR